MGATPLFTLFTLFILFKLLYTAEALLEWADALLSKILDGVEG